MSGERAHIVVVGAGVAGTAAAWAAGTRAKVTLIDGGAGASSFMSGALDLEPWEDQLDFADGAPPAALTSFVRALGIWSLGPARPGPGGFASLATLGGRVREAIGRDRALLDLTDMRGRTVLVPRADRAGWDADALAHAWLADAPPDLGLSFRAVGGAILRYEEETRISDAELATRHDDPARIAWLADRLRPAITLAGAPAAILLGPWLGSAASQADALSRLLGVPCGEALSGTAGTAGLRFEAARERVLGNRASILRARVESVGVSGKSPGAGFTVTLQDGPRPLTADAVILALGGLAGGGIVYRPPEYGAGADGPRKGRASFALSLDLADAILNGNGFRLGSSMHGPVLEDVAWPERGRQGALETVGISHDDGVLSPGVCLAGDVRRGAARTVLQAALSGLSAAATLVASLWEELSEAEPEGDGSPLRA